jgi:hypothetical protein
MLSRGLLALFAFSLLPAAGRARLRIETAEGEGANNNAMTSLSSRLVVRILDDRGPVSGALVVFAAPESGASVEFSDSGLYGEAASDESGVAVSPRFLPVGENGPFEIRVMATKAGVFVNSVIHQMNLGLHERELREEELDIVDLAAKAGATAPGGRSLQFRVRVETGKNRPLPFATVAVTLRSIGKSGKSADLWRTALVADEHGEAQCTVARPGGNSRLEFMAAVEAGGRRATRYFERQ